MGSGETAPTMVKPHREIFSRVDGRRAALMLDTPYGFQENADDISGRAVSYFAQSVARAGVPAWTSRAPCMACPPWSSRTATTPRAATTTPVTATWASAG